MLAKRGLRQLRARRCRRLAIAKANAQIPRGLAYRGAGARAQPALAGCRVGAVPDAESTGETPALAISLGAAPEAPFCVEPLLPTLSAVLPALAPALPLVPAPALAPEPPDDGTEPLEASGISLDGLLAASTAASSPSLEEPASGGAVPASMGFVARPVAPQKMRSCIVA